MLQPSAEKVQTRARLSEEGNPLGIMQATKIWSYPQILYA